jgi:hypothetical protein
MPCCVKVKMIESCEILKVRKIREKTIAPPPIQRIPLKCLPFMMSYNVMYYLFVYQSCILSDRKMDQYKDQHIGNSL